MMDSASGHSRYSEYLEENFGDTKLHKSQENESKKSVATCSICDKGFKSMWGYRCHVKIHSISVGNPENCYKCFQCDKFCQSVSHLRRHMRCHSTNKPYQCDRCGRGYKHNNGLRVHQCRRVDSVQPVESEEVGVPKSPVWQISGCIESSFLD